MIINGVYFSTADAVVNMDGLQISAIKALNYKDTLGRQYVRGTSAIPLGLTTGRYEASGDIELFLPSAGLITSVPGWRQIAHTMTVAYGPNAVAPLPFVIDTIPSFYLLDLEAGVSDSEDGLTRKFTFKMATPILWNGVPSFIATSTIGAVG